MSAGALARESPVYGTGRERLLTSAREVFAEKGYRGGTTRDIAERAGMTEPMVFRHFGSKASLFEEAAVEPVVAFMDDYVAEWGAREHGSADPVREVRDFISRLLEVMRGDRQLLAAILAAGQFDDALAPAALRLQQAFGRIIEMFEGMVETEFTLRRLDAPDRPAFARVLLGIVIAFSLHADWLAIGDDPHDVGFNRMLDEAARLSVFGVGSAST
jgi:AcrR family transcriptional regulator